MGLTVFLLGIGFVAGIASGMFGIGGGIIIVPALVLLLGFSIVEANGTSLAAFLLPVSLPAVLAYYRNRLIDLRAAGWIAGGMLAGVLGGAQIALSLPAETLRRFYGAFLLYICWRMIEPAVLWETWRNQGSGANGAKSEPRTEAEKRDTPFYWLLALGVLAGLSSGLFGIGGGNVIVPILAAFLLYDQKVAVATSLAALLMPVGLPGVLLYARSGALEIGYAVPIALGIIAGTFIGANITLRLSSVSVKRLYGVFLFFVAVKFLFF